MRLTFYKSFLMYCLGWREKNRLCVCVHFNADRYMNENPRESTHKDLFVSFYVSASSCMPMLCNKALSSGQYKLQSGLSDAEGTVAMTT